MPTLDRDGNRGLTAPEYVATVVWRVTTELSGPQWIVTLVGLVAVPLMRFAARRGVSGSITMQGRT